MKPYFLIPLLFHGLACNVLAPEGTRLPDEYTPIEIKMLSCNGASYTASGINLVANWNKAEGAEDYALTCKHSAGELEICRGSIESCSYSNFTAGTLYTCSLSASGPLGSAVCGNSFQFRGIGTFQNAGSSADTASSVTLRWTGSVGADEYQVHEVNNQGTNIRAISLSATSPLSITGLGAASTSYFQVTALSTNNTRALQAPIALTTQPSGPAFTLGLPEAHQPNSLRIHWQARSNLTGITLRHGTQLSNLNHATNCTTNPCIASNLTPGVLHFFRFEGTNNQNEVETSEVLSGTPIAAATLLSVDQTAVGTVTLAWNSVPGATSYTVQHGTDNTALSDTSSPTTGSSAVIMGLTAGTLHYFRLHATNSEGTVSGNTLSIRPVGSFTFQAVTLSGPQSLSYQFSNAVGATSYLVNRGTTNQNGTDGLSISSSPAVETNITPNIEYFLRLIATNQDGGRLESNVLTARALETPTFAISQSGADFLASWTPRTGVTYEIAHGSTANSFPNGVQTNVTSPATITGLNYGSTYFIRLTETNAQGSLHSIPIQLDNFYTYLGNVAVGGILVIKGPYCEGITAVSVGGTQGVLVSKNALEAKVLVMPGSASGSIVVSVGGSNRTITGFTLLQNSPPTVLHETKLVGAETIANDSLGSVALSADGNTLIVASTATETLKGAVWFFTRQNGVWTQQGTKTRPDMLSSGLHGFGQSVALSADGNKALIGAYYSNSTGAAWIYARTKGVWAPEAGPLYPNDAVGNPNMGDGAALSADGNTAIIGGTNDNNSQGASWVFAKVNGTWSQQGSKLVGSGGVGAAKRGRSHALSADGNTAFIGATGDNNSNGAAWVFTRSNGTWTQEGSKLTGSGSGNSSFLGTSVALSAEGDTAIAGGSGDNSSIGASWIFVRSAGTWTQQGSKLVGSGGTGQMEQGFAVSLSADGNTALVGGKRDTTLTGAIWYFTRSGGSWSPFGSKLRPSNLLTNTGFASKLSLSSDGSTAAVSGYGDASNKGAVWIYTSPNP